MTAPIVRIETITREGQNGPRPWHLPVVEVPHPNPGLGVDLRLSVGAPTQPARLLVYLDAVPRSRRNKLIAVSKYAVLFVDYQHVVSSVKPALVERYHVKVWYSPEGLTVTQAQSAAGSQWLHEFQLFTLLRVRAHHYRALLTARPAGTGDSSPNARAPRTPGSRSSRRVFTQTWYMVSKAPSATHIQEKPAPGHLSRKARRRKILTRAKLV